MTYDEKLSAVCDELQITCECRDGDASPDWPDATAWKVTLRFGRRRLTVPFYQGSAHTEPPTAADVLSCICSDTSCGEQTFEDFCSDLGYDTDSRKAESTHRQCARLAPRVRQFLGEHFDRVSCAEH